MQARRRGRHCLTASLMNTCWKCSRSWSGATSAGQRHDLAAVHTHAAYPKSCIVYRVELRSGLLAVYRARAMKSGVRVNSCTVSHWLRQPDNHSVTFTSVRVTAVPYVTLFWKPRYFVIDSWRLITRNQIFSNKIWWFFHKYIQNYVHIILLRCIQIWYFYRTLFIVVYFFPRHSVESTHRVQTSANTSGWVPKCNVLLLVPRPTSQKIINIHRQLLQ